jgi:CspA family cold shock protein
MANRAGGITMANGTVKWFSSQKGFGFIAPQHGSKDVFLQISALERAGLNQLDDGQAVTFELESGCDGRESAIDIAMA